MSDLGTASGRIIIDTAGVRAAQREVQTASRAMSQAFGAIGISLTVAGFVQLAKAAGQYAIQADAVATAYRRQSVAALSLAGSQDKLNELLEAYNRATGGAIDKATALSDVTRLQAIGFADSAQELERFARAARGISLATGQSQDYVISQLQLAIANQSTMRLDQLGLGVQEVTDRVNALRTANAGLTQEQAYQNAVLGLAEQKFGELTKAADAQATGAELATKSFKELRLAIGNVAGPGINLAGVLIAVRLQQEIDKLNTWIRLLREAQQLAQNFNSGGGTSGEARPNSPAPTRADQSPVLRQTIQAKQQELAALEQSYKELQAINTVDVSTALVQTKNHIDDLRHAIELLQQQERNYVQPELLPSAANRSGNLPAGPSEASQAATDAKVEFYQRTQEIEQQANRDRLQATQQYEQQRSQVIREYEKSIARDAEDFAVQRARAEEDYATSVQRMRRDIAQREASQAADLERTIADARTDAAERGAERLAELGERIADTRQQSNERLAELEADYNKSRERAEEDHKDRLMKAAGSLDAIALLEERKRFARQQQDAKENFDDRVAKERKNEANRLEELNKTYAKQTANEQAALDKRIADAQDAYQRQLEDARAADEQRLSDMSEDFVKRLAREDEDRAKRLERLKQDHDEQLGELARQHDLRMGQIDQQVEDEYQKLKTTYDKVFHDLGLQVDGYTAKLALATKNALALFDALYRGTKPQQGPQPQNPLITPGQFPSLNPTVPASNSSVTNNARTSSVNIQIYAQPGQDDKALVDAIVRALEGI